MVVVVGLYVHGEAGFFNGNGCVAEENAVKGQAAAYVGKGGINEKEDGGAIFAYVYVVDSMSVAVISGKDKNNLKSIIGVKIFLMKNKIVKYSLKCEFSFVRNA